MLAFALVLVVSVPMAVQATGMEPQLRIIREQAAKRNWPITCVGHSGEEGVVRIGVPAGTPSQAVDDFEETIKGVASSWGNLGVDATKATCDQEPVRVVGEGEMRTLIFTAGEPDPRLRAVAHDCGFPKAYWRATAPDDVARFGGRVDVKKFSNTLDAGENIVTHYGPMLCFLNMHRLVQDAAAKGALPTKTDNSH
jgi:hypothetical protein